MNITLDQITPDIVQAITTQATARSLSVNDYLRHLLGLSNGTAAEPVLAETRQEAPPQNEEMLAIIRRNHERLRPG